MLMFSSSKDSLHVTSLTLQVHTFIVKPYCATCANNVVLQYTITTTCYFHCIFTYFMCVLMLMLLRILRTKTLVKTLMLHRLQVHTFNVKPYCTTCANNVVLQYTIATTHYFHCLLTSCFYATAMLRILRK
jgi:hypothetical protein